MLARDWNITTALPLEGRPWEILRPSQPCPGVAAVCCSQMRRNLLPSTTHRRHRRGPTARRGYNVARTEVLPLLPPHLLTDGK